MTKKADFNAEEWSRLVEVPLLAGMRVITASKGGKLRETVAMSKEYAKARQQQGESELLDDLVASPPAIDSNNPPGEGSDLATVADERAREAVALLEAKATPEELESYKRFIMSVAEAAAKAHKEGGSLGVGGKEISDEEQAALDATAATLGLTSTG